MSYSEDEEDPLPTIITTETCLEKNLDWETCKMFNTITMQQHNATRETPKENDHNLCYIFGYNYNLNAFMSQNYGEVHGYICLVICIFGAISNLLNIIVLTRKEMNGSPINRILSGMALADITLVLEYIPFLAYTQLIGKPGGWGWAAYLWFHSNFSVVIHNVSVWLTLTVAVWRFIMIKYHTWVPVYCTMERCHLVMLSAYVGPILLTIPQYFAFTIRPHKPCDIDVNDLNQTTIEDYKQNSSISFHTDGNNRTCIYSEIIYVVQISDFGQQNNHFFFGFTVWLYSFILKFVPSIVLTVFTGFLIHALYKAEERSARLKQTRRTNVGAGPPGGLQQQQQVQHLQVQSPPSPPIDEEAQAAAVSNANGQVTTSSQTQNNKHLRVAMNNNSNPMIASTLNHIRSLSIRRKSNQAATAGNHGGGGSNGHHQPSSRKKSTDRTTRLLIVILVLFLITEFPQAIMGMTSAIYTEFFMNCYQPLGDLMDDIALLNSSINFVIYYLMSRQFRKTFIDHFGLRWCDCPPMTTDRDGSRNQRNNHEMRPLMSQRATCQPTTDLRSVQPLQPLQPRPQIVMQPLAPNPPVAAETNSPAIVVTASATKEAAVEKENNLPTISETNYVLKRTSDPEERV